MQQSATINRPGPGPFRRQLTKRYSRFSLLLRRPVEHKHYAAGAYIDQLAAIGAVALMSRTACCYDNAPMESFFLTLKVEFVHQRRWATHDEARRDLFAYIQGYYNRHCIHSAIGISPQIKQSRWQAKPMSTKAGEDQADAPFVRSKRLPQWRQTSRWRHSPARACRSMLASGTGTGQIQQHQRTARD